jgi:hypothetical protein
MTNDEEIRAKALEFALRCIETKLVKGSQNAPMDSMVNDIIASAKKFETFIKP